MGNPRRVLGVLTAMLLLAGCGGGSDGGESTRTVDVEMRDIAYAPTAVSVKAGEAVKFVFHNAGQIRHDAFLGDEAAQAEHEKEMRGEGGMHHGDDAITLDPGKTGSLTHTFRPGESLVIGCHEAGHYVAGMKLTLPVT